MKCRICGSECPPGAKLCRDCAAARKRAFAATVTVPLLAAGGGARRCVSHRFAPKPQRPGPKSPKVQVQAPAMKSVRRGQPASSRPGRDSAGGSDRGHESRQTGSACCPLAGCCFPRHRATGSLPIVWVVGATMAVAVVAFRRASNVRGTWAFGASPRISRLPRRRVRLFRPSPLLPPVRGRPEASAGEASTADRSAVACGRHTMHRRSRHRPRRRPNCPYASVPRPKPSKLRRPQQRRRSWTSRSEWSPRRCGWVETTRTDPCRGSPVRLARCAREDMIARLGCEHRARAQYCGDSWGQIPQCAIGPRPITVNSSGFCPGWLAAPAATDEGHLGRHHGQELHVGVERQARHVEHRARDVPDVHQRLDCDLIRWPAARPSPCAPPDRSPRCRCRSARRRCRICARRATSTWSAP